jgi:hypothetical protein
METRVVRLQEPSSLSTAAPRLFDPARTTLLIAVSGSVLVLSVLVASLAFSPGESVRPSGQTGTRPVTPLTVARPMPEAAPLTPSHGAS